MRTSWVINPNKERTLKTTLIMATTQQPPPKIIQTQTYSYNTSQLIAHMPIWTREITTWWKHINKTRFLVNTNLEFHTVSWHLNKIWNPKSRTNTNTLIFFIKTTFPIFDVAKLVFSPPSDTPNHEEHVDLTTNLSLEKFLSFGYFDSRYVVFWG